jgi:hypothetical protein
MHCEAEKAPGVAVVEPAAQAAHAAREKAPAAPSLKRPSGQSVGAAAPAAGAYLPGGAGVQAAAPGGAKKPAAQSAQEDSDVAPAWALAVPAGQLAQAADVWPGAGLYVPARQGVQFAAALPPAKSRAAPAGQGAQRAEPGEGAKEPGGQPPQSPADDAPLKGFSVPTGQARQAAALLERVEGP